MQNMPHPFREIFHYFFLLQSIIPSFTNPYFREYSNWTSIVGKIRFVWP